MPLVWSTDSISTMWIRKQIIFTGAAWTAVNDSLYLYRFTKSNPTKIEKISTLPAPIFQVFTVPGTGKIFVSSYETSNGEDGDIYVLNTDGSNITRVEIPEY